MFWHFFNVFFVDCRDYETVYGSVATDKEKQESDRDTNVNTVTDKKPCNIHLLYCRKRLDSIYLTHYCSQGICK